MWHRQKHSKQTTSKKIQKIRANIKQIFINFFLESCKKCFECPECNTTLKMSERAINTSGQQGASALKEKEHTVVTFFQCTFCKWTSLPGLCGTDPTNLVGLFFNQFKISKFFFKFFKKIQKNTRNLKREERRQARLRNWLKN